MLVVAIALAANVCMAQGDLKPKKFENPSWKRVVMISFQPGKMERAMTIVKDYFMVASKKAGTTSPDMMLDMYSGGWDVMVIWSMKGGLEELNWEISPDNIAWQKALAEVAGGEEKAKALRAEYSSLVARSSAELARVR